MSNPINSAFATIIDTNTAQIKKDEARNGVERFIRPTPAKMAGDAFRARR